MYTIKGTNQEIFNKVCQHLAKQRVRSIVISEDSTIECLYKNALNFKCAIGCLIPKSFYRKKMEGKNIDYLIQLELLKIVHADQKMLLELQLAHDRSVTLQELKENLCKIAIKYSLNPSAVDFITEWKSC